MTSSILAAVDWPKRSTDRRADGRPTMVLRVGLLAYEGKSSFCILRNISTNGVQVKLYSAVCEGADVSLRVGDECPLEGRVVWARQGIAGIAFKGALDPNTLLRVRQMAAPHRRRTSPRAPASAFGILRTGGQEYSAQLCDISASGAKILTAKSVEFGPTAVLVLPNLPALRAFVRWTQGQETGLVFETPIPIQIITDWLSGPPNVTGN